MIKLEASGKLTTQFATPSRVRPAWGFDRAGDPVDMGGDA